MGILKLVQDIGLNYLSGAFSPKPIDSAHCEADPCGIVPFTPNSGAQEQVYRFLEDPDPDVIAVYFRGGIGAGKSFLGSAFCVHRSLTDPTGRGLITANSYGQLETSTLVGLAEYCEYHHVPLTPSGADVEQTARTIANRHYCYINGVFHYVLSADIFTGKTQNSKETGRGLQVRWAWGDEFAYADVSAFNTIMGRIGRGAGISKRLFLLTSSINKNKPKNWVYDKFDDPERTIEQKEKFITFVGRTSENRHLGGEYISQMQATLTGELFTLEVESEYVTITEGLIFKYFKAAHHTIASYNIDLTQPIHLSFDFNYSPSCAIAAQFIDGELIVFKEWYLLNAGTFELIGTVREWLNRLQITSYELRIHGDATGHQRTANSTQTNWGIIIGGLKGLNYKTQVGRANPEVQDSINALNAAFMHSRLFLTKPCIELTKDLESLKYNETGEIDKKTDKMRSHLVDCVRYLANDLMPLSNPVKWTSRARVIY